MVGDRGIFVFLSLDEAIGIHEHLHGLVSGRGVLFFSWVIPASILVGGSVSRSLASSVRLDAIDRRRLGLSAALYVGGTLAMELGARRSRTPRSASAISGARAPGCSSAW